MHHKTPKITAPLLLLTLCACGAGAHDPPQTPAASAAMTRWQIQGSAPSPEATLELRAPDGAASGEGTLCVEEATRRCVAARVWQDRCTVAARFLMPEPEGRTTARPARASLTLTCAPQPNTYTGALWLEGTRTAVRARRML